MEEAQHAKLDTLLIDEIADTATLRSEKLPSMSSSNLGELSTGYCWSRSS